MTNCKQGQEGYCIRCEYEKDMAINPKAWKWWQWKYKKWKWSAWQEFKEPIEKEDFDDTNIKIRRSPSAPDRDEWVKTELQRQIDNATKLQTEYELDVAKGIACATCRHEYEKKGE